MRPDRQDDHGHLVHRQGGSWAFHYDTGANTPDEVGFHFADERFVTSEYAPIDEGDQAGSARLHHDVGTEHRLNRDGPCHTGSSFEPPSKPGCPFARRTPRATTAERVDALDSPFESQLIDRICVSAIFDVVGRCCTCRKLPIALALVIAECTHTFHIAQQGWLRPPDGRFVDTQRFKHFWQFACAERTLPHQDAKIGGRHAELACDPFQFAWTGLELHQFRQLPPLLEPIPEQIDHLGNQRKDSLWALVIAPSMVGSSTMASQRRRVFAPDQI